MMYSRTLAKDHLAIKVTFRYFRKWSVVKVRLYIGCVSKSQE